MSCLHVLLTCLYFSIMTQLKCTLTLMNEQLALPGNTVNTVEGNEQNDGDKMNETCHNKNPSLMVNSHRGEFNCITDRFHCAIIVCVVLAQTTKIVQVEMHKWLDTSSRRICLHLLTRPLCSNFQSEYYIINFKLQFKCLLLAAKLWEKKKEIHIPFNFYGLTSKYVIFCKLF